MVTEKAVQRHNKLVWQLHSKANYYFNGCMSVESIKKITLRSHLPTRSVSNHYKFKLPVLAVLLWVRHGFELWPHCVSEWNLKVWGKFTGVLNTFLQESRMNYKAVQKDRDRRHFETLVQLRSAWSIYTLVAVAKLIRTIKQTQLHQKHISKNVM